MATLRPISHLIVMGSSAGGIEALSTVVATLPPDLPAPVVIGQHLDPSRQSHLQEILGRRSTLPVRTISEDAPEALQPGVVYVVPANRDVYVSDSSIELRSHADAHGGMQPQPSIDLLLTSAADTFGDRLVAIILSGTGSDGAAGARAVKKAGGTVIIQNPDTASYPGMPLSLAPTTVDIVANLDRIGPILHDLLAGIDVPTQPEERRELEVFLQDVRARFDIDFSSYKTPTIMRRLQRRILATGVGDLNGYIAYLRTHPEEYQQLVNAFLINVTDFFRDPELFNYLRDHVLPDLIEYARQHGNELRIWSAGCATGEEAYSLAILLAEALGNEMDQMNVRIFATDVDPDAVAFARRGVYPSSAVSAVPEDLLARYFTRENNTYVIRKRVRSLTVFGQHDLGQRAPFPHIDMVVCRDVLIYFTPALQQRTLRLFAYSLREGGYLVLGRAESSGSLGEYFAPMHKVHKVYQRQGDRVLMPPARLKEVAAPAPHRLGMRRGSPNVLSALPREQEVQRLRVLNESILQRMPIGIIVVDRQYDIHAINGGARRLLSIHSPAIGEDLVHLAQDVPPIQLRQAIDNTFRTGVPTGLDEVPLEDLSSGEQRFVQIVCHPQRLEGDQGAIEAVVVVVSDTTRQVGVRRQLQEQIEMMRADLQNARSAGEEESARRDQTIGRLMEANRQLLEANQELTSTNEELRTTNEEFLLSTEEAQAATEEVETLNEELQATNEELETLNEELQATIEELNTTNDDLHARSVELQDLAQTSEQARLRAEAILLSMGDAVVQVDSTGKPVLTNAAYERMFGTGGMRLVPGDERGHVLSSDATPLRRAARGESFSMEFTIRAEDGSFCWFEANGAPIRGAEGVQAGGVVVIRDITERSLRRLQEEFIARASHELRTPLTPIRAALQRLVEQVRDQPDDAPARRYAETALTQIERLSRLVDELLDVSRLQSGEYRLEMQPVSLNELLSSVVRTAHLMTEKQTIQLALPDAQLVVTADPQRLEQILLNLLSNAITYAPGADRIDVRLRQVEDEAEIQVQDYGPGVPAEQLPHLFTQFYQGQGQRPDTTSQPGLGLGLFIVHEIVTAHGGRIEATSSVGQGTTFTIRLPLRGAGQAPGSEPHGDDPRRRRRG